MNFQNIVFELAAGRKDQFPWSGPLEVVFSGKSNVGKSSLINKLVNRKSLARVSATPGKTVTINFYKMGTCRLVDLPGYGYAKVSKAEKERLGVLVEDFFAGERNIALVVQLLDFRHDPSREDEDMVNFLLNTGLPFVVACTKCDKLNKTQTAAQIARYHALFDELQIPFFPFSAVSGQGVEELRAYIEDSVTDTKEKGDEDDLSVPLGE